MRAKAVLALINMKAGCGRRRLLPKQPRGSARLQQLSEFFLSLNHLENFDFLSAAQIPKSLRSQEGTLPAVILVSTIAAPCSMRSAVGRLNGFKHFTRRKPCVFSNS
jgi:hypothetical protein